jgi:flagellin
MSFRINTNLQAMNAHRNAGLHAMDMDRSMSRLSTGLRIETAADDPSGLIASERFRSQITSIDAATRNNLDAINYVRTAESALGEVNKLLNEARALAIASGNTAVLSASQIQANMDQMSSIATSISRIARDTSFGTRRLLDGSAGVQTQVSAGAQVQGFSVSGMFGGLPITQSGLASINAKTAGTRATFASSVLTGGVVLNAGSFNINGTTFNFPAGTSGTAVAAAVNNASSQTSVTASFNTTTNILTLNSVGYGSNARINFSDANNVINTGTVPVSVAGTDALATITYSGRTVLFTGGRGNADGLTLTDSEGNMLKLTEAGNTAGVPLTIGQIISGMSNFQIGANAFQTTQVGLPNLNASQLGADIITGLNLSTLDLTTGGGVTQALQVIDRAIEQVTTARGRMGQFQRYILESNNRSLGSAKENQAASESTIRDVDMAAEMTSYTKSQMMRQAGMSLLSQANQLPQDVLSLLRG